MKSLSERETYYPCTSNMAFLSLRAHEHVLRNKNGLFDVLKNKLEIVPNMH